MVAVDIIREILTPAWRLFTDTPVPGLSSETLTVTFADLLIAVILIQFSVALLSSGLGIGSIGVRSGSSYRSGSTKNPKISAERKGDQY